MKPNFATLAIFAIPTMSHKRHRSRLSQTHMKQLLLISVLVLIWCVRVCAETTVIIDINGSEKDVRYTVNGWSVQVEQIGELVRSFTKQSGTSNPIIVRPDRLTTFAIVYRLLERLKASGAVAFTVVAERSSSQDAGLTPILTISADSLTRETIAPGGQSTQITIPVPTVEERENGSRLIYPVNPPRKP